MPVNDKIVEARDGGPVAKLLHVADSKIEANQATIEELKNREPFLKTSEGATFMEKWRVDLQKAFDVRIAEEKAAELKKFEAQQDEIEELKQAIIRGAQMPVHLDEKANEALLEVAFEAAFYNVAKRKCGFPLIEMPAGQRKCYIDSFDSNPDYAEKAADYKTLNTSTFDQGGSLVLPPTVRAGIINVALEQVQSIAQFCMQETISSETFTMPTQTSDGGYGWVGEHSTMTPTGEPTFGQEKFSLKTIYAVWSLTRKQIQFSRIPIVRWMKRHYVKRFASGFAKAQMRGLGTLTPLGLYHTKNIRTYKQGAGTIANFDALKKMRYSLHEDYLAGLRWSMTRATRAELDVIKDENGRYYLGDNVAGQSGNTLFGYPITFNENCDQIAPDGRPILLGNFGEACISITHTGANVMIEDIVTAAQNAEIKYTFMSDYDFGTFNPSALIFLEMN